MHKTLQNWLDWQETLHPLEVDLGLQRVEQVLQKLLPECGRVGDDFCLPCTVITVAGTNGKGSTVAMLEAIFAAAGYQVGSYTSPHLLRYNERVKINQAPVSDQLLCDSFERINQARGSLSISYFEFGTLAAIDIFYHQACEIVILEVGLGGRLDAVNVIDADVALVTTVDIDHQDWLGSTREIIAVEKAGIYRKNKPAIFGDVDLPKSIEAIVLEQELNFYQYSVDYKFELRVQQWDWLIPENNLSKKNIDNETLTARYNLPLPNLKGEAQIKNAANVLMVLELLNESCPVTQTEIKLGLQNVQLPGRFHIISSEPRIILDVAHNVQAATVLRNSLRQLKSQMKSVGKLHVIVGMLKDKEVLKVLSVLAPIVDSWRIIDLDTPRAMPAADIAILLNEYLRTSKITSSELKTTKKSSAKVQCFPNFKQAYRDFNKVSLMFNAIDTLLVFGSFFTVSDALQQLQQPPTKSRN